MRAKKAKMLRRLARKICTDMKRPTEVEKQYKMLKTIYKSNKGQI
jgi:hypothetical protein